MNRESIPTLHASQAIEDLLVDSNASHSQQNWLLSYLDVFVLIVMLVITLLAMTDTTKDSLTHSKKLLVKKHKPSKSIKSTKKINPKPKLKSITKAISKQLPKPVIQDTHQLNSKPNLKQDRQINDIKNVAIVDPNKNKKAKPSEKIIDSVVDQRKSPEQKIVNKESHAKNTVEPIKSWQGQLKNKLEKLELNKFVTVEIGEGFAQIEIQDNILFESAKAQLSKEGKDLLIDLAVFLEQSEGLIFIEGHTDNKPISTKNFPSNWELGSARATSVLHFLTSEGLNSRRLRAITYADTKPIEDNSTEYGRQRNRRVNLLVKIPDD